MKNRNSNIELARIFAIIGVIILHYNSYGAQGAVNHVQAGSINFYVCHALEAAFICAVNLFVMISGYFLCENHRRSLWKPIELIVQTSTFSCLLNILYPIVTSRGEGLSPSILWALLPDNYYVILYCVLYLISPFINTIYAVHSKKELKCYLTLSLLLFSVFPTLLDVFNSITGIERTGLSTISIFGSLKGYSIINFVLMYGIGAYFRKCNPQISSWSTGKLLVAIGMCIAGLTLWSTSVQDKGIAWNYCNPIVILLAVLYFVLFSKFPHKNNKVINKMAEGTFSVYLLHGSFIAQLNVDYFATQPIWKMLGHMAISVCGIYCVCWIGHVVYSAVSRPVFRLLSRHDSLIVVDTTLKK